MCGLLVCLYPSIALQMLRDTLTSLHAQGIDNPDYLPVHTHILNPKVSIDYHLLFVMLELPYAFQTCRVWVSVSY